MELSRPELNLSRPELELSRPELDLSWTYIDSSTHGITRKDLVFPEMLPSGCTSAPVRDLLVGVAPGSLVFHCVMLLPIPILADYKLIKQKKQAGIDARAEERIANEQNMNFVCF